MIYAGNWRVRCSDARRPGRLQRSRRHGRRNRVLEARWRVIGTYVPSPASPSQDRQRCSRRARSRRQWRRFSTARASQLCRDAEPRGLRPARAGWSEPCQGAWRSRQASQQLHCVAIVKRPKEDHSGRVRGEGFPTYIRIAGRVGHRRPIVGPHLWGARRDAHGARSANQRSEYIFLTHEAITRSMTGGRLKHFALVRLRDKHGHIMLRPCSPHSVNDVPLGGRRYGHSPTAACWSLQRELGSNRVPAPSIPD